MAKIINITPLQFFWISIGFMASIITTCISASIFQSSFVLIKLQSVGAEITTGAWLHTIWHDLYGLIFGGYIPFGLAVTLGFFVALPTAALICKLFGIPKWILYPLATAVALVTIRYTISSMFLDLILLVGTRGVVGLTFYLLAGALGGLVYVWVSNQYLRYAKRL